MGYLLSLCLQLIIWKHRHMGYLLCKFSLAQPWILQNWYITWYYAWKSSDIVATYVVILYLLFLYFCTCKLLENLLLLHFCICELLETFSLCALVVSVLHLNRDLFLCKGDHIYLSFALTLSIISELISDICSGKIGLISFCCLTFFI